MGYLSTYSNLGYFELSRYFVVNRLWDARREALRAVLKRFRTANGLTQMDMSTLLSKPQSYVSKYESGERRLDFVEVMEICEALEVQPNKFVNEYCKESGHAFH